MSDLYFSVDVETSGPTPLYHSMFSIGVAVIREDKIVSEFTRNLQVLDPYVLEDEPIPGYISTKRFWETYPDAWKAHRSGTLYTPEKAFSDLGVWVDEVRQLGELPVFLAYPATFDFAWCLAYGRKFASRDWKFGFSGFCMQSFAAAILNVPFSQARSKNWPRAWKSHTSSHTHIAVQDAVEQAKTFIEMRKSLQQKRKFLNPNNGFTC